MQCGAVLDLFFFFSPFFSLFAAYGPVSSVFCLLALSASFLARVHVYHIL